MFFECFCSGIDFGLVWLCVALWVMYPHNLQTPTQESPTPGRAPSIHRIYYICHMLTRSFVCCVCAFATKYAGFRSRGISLQTENPPNARPKDVNNDDDDGNSNNGRDNQRTLAGHSSPAASTNRSKPFRGWRKKNTNASPTETCTD